MNPEAKASYGGLDPSAGKQGAQNYDSRKDKLVTDLKPTVAVRTREALELSRYLIRIAEEEKATLARNLHDELGASLTAINLDLAYVSAKLNGSEPQLVKRLQRAIDTLRSTIDLKRRIVQDLWPTMLDHLGLSAAILAHCKDFCLRTGLSCTVDVPEELEDIDPACSIALYRVAQESLTNIAKHAQARNVNVILKLERGGLRLQVIDDGIGISADVMNTPMSHGLLGMRERVSQLGGTFNIRRRAGERGTIVEAFIAGGAHLRQSRSGPDNTSTPRRSNRGGAEAVLKSASIERRA
jgi:signal transduction histidine kinase